MKPAGARWARSVKFNFKFSKKFPICQVLFFNILFAVCFGDEVGHPLCEAGGEDGYGFEKQSVA